MFWKSEKKIMEQNGVATQEREQVKAFRDSLLSFL